MIQEEDNLMTDSVPATGEKTIAKKKSVQLKKAENNTRKSSTASAPNSEVTKNSNNKTILEDKFDKNDSAEKDGSTDNTVQDNVASKNQQEGKHKGFFTWQNKRGKEVHQNPNKKSNNNRKNKNAFSKGKNKRKKISHSGENRDSEVSNNSIEIGNLVGETFFNDDSAIKEMIDQISNNEESIKLNQWFKMPFAELSEKAQELGLELDVIRSRAYLYRQMMKACQEKKITLHAEGVLEIQSEGYGLLVYSEDNYQIRPHSVFVHAAMIEKYGLKNGQMLLAQIYPPLLSEGCPFLLKVESIFGVKCEASQNIDPFGELLPYYPLERLLLESEMEVNWDNTSMRIFDLITPIGLGQRGLIVAPPRTGKTVLLQGIANAIARNRPDVSLIVLLVDERPEEVTDFSRQVKGEVVSSTFDESAENHVHVAEVVIEKARRMVEVGRDVVILLDSITRLARAYNTLMPNSGKILSGGVEANALQRPKRFFGSARNIEGGGSLTIIATALVETGSRMDEVIFEEFKGTGNMEIHLDRALVDKRVFPAINFEKSGTRKEELLYHPQEMEKIYSLRRAMKGVPSIEAMEMLIQRVKKTKTNAEFLMGLNR